MRLLMPYAPGILSVFRFVMIVKDFGGKDGS